MPTLQENLEYSISASKSFANKKFILGIAEKPTAAERIALTLNPNAKKITFQVSRIDKNHKQKLPSTLGYFLELENNNLIILSALGHLFTLVQDGVGWQYPVYDFKWVPSHLAVKNTQSLTDFHLRIESAVEVLRYLANKTKKHVIMTDYDEEGEVIGAIILSKLVGEYSLSKAKRMRFSSFDPKEIHKSYDEALKRGKTRGIDFGMYNRGLMRHYLDWLWGINLSRALMLSLKNISGQYFTLSTGRVQGPTLYFVAKRKHEIETFVPIPSFKINCQIKLDKPFDLIYSNKQVEQENTAKKIIKTIKDANAQVSSITQKMTKRPPPVPYNLSSLQRDAYRYYKITPSRALQAAENLYLAATISYPRTSSEKYPTGINHKDILNNIAKQAKYLNIAQKVIVTSKIFTPTQGKNTDPAHPCIYPLGTKPQKVSRDQEKIYDLIIHRYFATFGKPAEIENNRIDFDVAGELFYVTGKRTIKPGWIDWGGGYHTRSDSELPKLSENDEFPVIKANYDTLFSKPKPRYNQSSLLKKMEEVEIGTKATRSEIIKGLFDRKFLTGDPISITPIGETITEVLQKYSSQVISVELSRKLEQMGDLIQKTINMTNTTNSKFLLSDAIVQGITYLHQMLEDIQINERRVGELISKNLKSQRREATIIGTCMQCKTGNLKIIHSVSSGKRFIGCSQYFEDKSCNATFPLPQKGRLEPQSKVCPSDGYPRIKVFGSKKPWILCINPECPLREKRKNKNKTKGD